MPNIDTNKQNKHKPVKHELKNACFTNLKKYCIQFQFLIHAIKL